MPEAIAQRADHPAAEATGATTSASATARASSEQAEQWVGAQARELIDRLASQYAVRPSVGEAERARGEYDGWRGRVFEDDEIYATHIATFLEWFVLERATAEGLAPVVLALASGELDDAAARLACALACSYRSLFEVREVSDSMLRLADLIGGGRWQCGGDGPLPLVSAGDLMEARLVPWRGRVALGPVALFHPPGAHQAIHALLGRWRAQGRLSARSLGPLAERCLRWGRVRNIAVERIYCD
ncbi:MAG: hypothetical protein IPL40_15915 [Proteobacteria bacterium]|nr:hypothetical protein [Pseudomonadota bacterium]